jgi:hypothetical protein
MAQREREREREKRGRGSRKRKENEEKGRRGKERHPALREWMWLRSSLSSANFKAQVLAGYHLLPMTGPGRLSK